MYDFSDAALDWSPSWRERRCLLLLAITVGVTSLVYFTELTNFTLSADEALRSFGGVPWRRNITHARWGLALLNSLLPPLISVIPFVPTLLFVLLLSGSATLLALIYTSRLHAAYAFAITFACSPVWFHTAQISIVSWSFATGLLATACALYCMKSRRLVHAALLLAFATGVYQAFATLFVAGSLVQLMQQVWGSGDAAEHAPFRPAVRDYIIVTFAGALLYYGVSKALLLVIKADLTYVNEFLRLSDYATDEASLGRVFKRASGMLFGFDATFVGVGAASLLLVWLGAFQSLRRFFAASLPSARELSILSLGLTVLLVSVALLIMSAGHMPTRALVCFPLIHAAFAAQAFTWHKQRRILWALLGLAVAASTYAATALFHSDDIARDRDFVVATRLVDRIESLTTSAFGRLTPLAVVGQIMREADGPALRVEAFGASFFEQDGGNPYRIAAYLNLVAGTHYTGVAIADLADNWRAIDNRPAWPAEGSVFLTGNEVVVKFGEPSSEQRMRLRAVGLNVDSVLAASAAASVLPSVRAESWGQTRQTIQLFAPTEPGQIDPAFMSRVIGSLYGRFAGDTLHFQVAVPQWVVFDNAGEVYRGADGMLLVVTEESSGQELYRLALNPHANPADRKWFSFPIVVRPGIEGVVLELQPGDAPDVNNRYDQLLVSVREPLAFRNGLMTR